MSRASVGEVLELFISEPSKRERIPKMVIELDEGGVVSDKFHGKEKERSVLLTTTGSYAMARNENITIAHGSLGENILMDYNPYSLPMGKQIEIGEVLLEVTQHCTICNHLSMVDPQLPTLLKDDRGIFVKVVQSGAIRRGDKIYLL